MADTSALELAAGLDREAERDHLLTEFEREIAEEVRALAGREACRQPRLIGGLCRLLRRCR